MQSEHTLPSNAAEVAGRPRVLSASATRTWAIERWLLRSFLRLAGRPRIRCILPDGEAVYVADGEAAGTIRFRDRGALYRFLTSSEMGFGKGYTDGAIEVEGDIVALIDAVYEPALAPWAERLVYRSGRAQRNSLSGSRHNIHRHYDLGNDFYRLWLDERLLYTCAYYPTPEATLEEAQVAKMHHVCRKVALRPGERVVEAGCGWGALALHVALHYGVLVRAFNISHEQIAWARQQAARAGLADRVEFIEDDYRSITGTYDCFVSVGMLEHVGIDHYRELGAVIDRCLPAHGRGLIHTIGRNRRMPLNAWIADALRVQHRDPPLRPQRRQAARSGQPGESGAEHRRIGALRALQRPWRRQRRQQCRPAARVIGNREAAHAHAPSYPGWSATAALASFRRSTGLRAGGARSAPERAGDPPDRRPARKPVPRCHLG